MRALLLLFALGSSAAAVASTLRLQDGVSPAPAYAGTRDLLLLAPISGEPFDPNRSYVTNDCEVDGFPSEIATLLRFDVSAVPASARVRSVSLDVTLTDPDSASYSIYEVLRPWSATQVNWMRATPAQPWGLPGAQQTGADRSGVVIGIARGPDGAVLNAQAVPVAQRWVSTPASNFGVLISDPSQRNGLHFHSGEAGTVGQRPRLTITTEDGGAFTFQSGASGYAGSDDVVIAHGPPYLNAASKPLLLESGEADVLLMGFDVPPRPGAVLVAARLVVHVVSGTTGTFRIYAMNHRWEEQGASWSSATAGTSWTADGGFSSADHLPQPIGELRLAGGPGPATATFADAGLQLLQSWLRGIEVNDGIVIIPATSATPTLELASRESADAGLRPALELDWTLPDGGEPAESDGGSLGDGDAGSDAGPLHLTVACGCGGGVEPGAALLLPLALWTLLRRRR